MMQDAGNSRPPYRRLFGVRTLLGLLGAAVGTVACALTIAVLAVHFQHRAAAVIESSGALVARQIAGYATEPMVANDRLRLQALLQQAVANDLVLAAEITDSDHKLVVRAGVRESEASGGLDASAPITLNDNTAGTVHLQMKPPSAAGVSIAGIIAAVVAAIIGYAAGVAVGSRLQLGLATLRRRLATDRHGPMVQSCREIADLDDALGELDIRPREQHAPVPVRSARVVMAVVIGDLDAMLEHVSPAVLDARLGELDRRLKAVVSGPEASLIAHRRGRGVVFAGTDAGLRALRAAALLQRWTDSDAEGMPASAGIGIDCEEDENNDGDNALRAICWQRTVDRAFRLAAGDGTIRVSRLFLTLEGVGDHAAVAEIDADQWQINTLATELGAEIDRRVLQLAEERT